MWEQWLFDRRPVARPRRQAHYRPWLERLEERALLNSRFVVPVTAPFDNQSSFPSLRSALVTSGLAVVDVIQIAPGSSPGNIANADVPTSTNRTIQGNAAAGLAATPMFTVSDPLLSGLGRIGFTLRGVNVGLVGSGSLTFTFS